MFRRFLLHAVDVHIKGIAHTNRQFDQIGRFFKVLGNKFLENVVQIFGDFWAIMKIITPIIKTTVLALGKIWTTFHSNICSQSYKVHYDRKL